ncbi:acyltransferase 3 [Solidesulfovibrio fructosivorans JJ]]|uniref:Acyltransferase 3 n=2 Tax=Solidesulfovibrio fructosivorans TaxID=878 RepID=E1JXM8_SOLFR|nr:acyltransferase 3 [Solidesulfovibrio fructosivorans JJ]]
MGRIKALDAVSPLAYRPDIDGLRAFAVLAVVGYHAFPTLFPGGFIGVDVFFVISGYLISGIILNSLEAEKFSFWDFYCRRILRIFPALLAVLTTVLILGWAFLLPDEYSALGKHVFGGSSFLSNFFLWHESGYFDVAAKSKPLLHLWSLGIEEQFYIVFPLLLFLCVKGKLRVGFVIAALCLLSFADNIYLHRTDTIADFYSPLARVWELFSGALLRIFVREGGGHGVPFQSMLNAWCRKALPGKIQCGVTNWLPSALSASLGAICLGGMTLFYSKGNQAWPSWKALLPTVGTILLIKAGRQQWINNALLSNRFVVGIGLVSYPFYLWHWPLISLAFVINGKLESDMWLLRLGLVCVSLCLAVLTYWLIEKPIRFGNSARKAKVWCLITLMVCAGGVGLFIWHYSGLPERAHMKAFAAAIETMNGTASAVHDDKALRYAPDIPHDRYSYYGYTDVGGKTTIAVIGDSHAPVAYRGMAKVNAGLGFNTFLVASTIWVDRQKPTIITPLLGLWKYALKSTQRDTEQRTRKMLESIVAKKDIVAVFIFTRGPIYFTGFEPSAPTYIHPIIIPAKGFAEALQDTVNFFKKEGKLVYIVSENPELPVNLRQCISRPFSKARTVPRLTKEEVVTRQRKYLAILDSIKGATVINSLDFFCPQGECLSFTPDGLPLYRDSDHLSLVGSHLQAEKLLMPYLLQLKDRGYIEDVSGSKE